MFESIKELNNQAVTLASRGYYDEAIACLKRAITVEKSNLLLWFNLGITYRDHGDFKKAKEAFLYARKISPQDEAVLEALADLCISMKDFDEALTYCDEGIDFNNFNPHFWNLAGVVNFNLSDYASASTFFEYAVSMDSNYYDALYNLRDTYAELKNKAGYEECCRALSRLRRGDNL